MAVNENDKEQSIGYDFEDESGFQKKKYMIQVKCWDMKSAKEFMNGTWTNFCKVSNKINEESIYPWINPSIEFTSNSNVSSNKKIHTENMENI